MEVRPDSTVAELIDSIGDYEQRSAEEKRKTADKFPVTVEEYLALPETDRLEVACKIVGTYFPYMSYEKFDFHTTYPPEGKSATAKVPTNQPGIILNGAIAYDRGENSEWRSYRPSGLFVWVQAEDATSDIKSPFIKLGRIELHRPEPKAVIWVEGAKDHETTDLSDPRVQEMIEVIDAAAVNLISGVIAQNRSQIGQSALSGLQQA